MNITNGLLIIILFILVEQFYPTTAEIIIAMGIAAFALYACYWLATQFPARWKKRKAERWRAEQDEREYWNYQKQHDSIRAKYDPRHEWNEATSVPSEYLDEIRRLNLEHRGMLQRRNGWTAEDFRQ
ncbi:MAG TPA: hypothetical protein VEG25_09660 [Burkholderiales bacterium]|nr:hypothetical protein [Burkholderiales bacterium]